MRGHPHTKYLLVLFREVRKEAGLTQVEVAAALSKPQSFVSKYEHGERRLDVLEFVDVCRVLGIRPAEFLARLEAVVPTGMTYRRRQTQRRGRMVAEPSLSASRRKAAKRTASKRKKAKR